MGPKIGYKSNLSKYLLLLDNVNFQNLPMELLNHLIFIIDPKTIHGFISDDYTRHSKI